MPSTITIHSPSGMMILVRICWKLMEVGILFVSKIFINLLGASSVLSCVKSGNHLEWSWMVHMVHVCNFYIFSCELLWNSVGFPGFGNLTHLTSTATDTMLLWVTLWVTKNPRSPGSSPGSTPVQPNVPAMMTAPKQNTAEPSCTAEPETSQALMHWWETYGDMMTCCPDAVHQGIDEFMTQAGSTTANPDVTWWAMKMGLKWLKNAEFGYNMVQPTIQQVDNDLALEFGMQDFKEVAIFTTKLSGKIVPFQTSAAT